MRIRWKKSRQAIDAFGERHRVLLGAILVLAAVIAFYVQGNNLNTDAHRIAGLERANTQRIDDILTARKQSRRLVYCGVDKLADAVRLILKPTTAAELRVEIGQINAGIAKTNLPQAQKTLLLQVLDALAAAEISNSALTHLGHQFTFKDLPCQVKPQ